MEFNSLTPIQTFYCGKAIFITGGTGFLGKVLAEKLLRNCPGVKILYLLLRPKKGKSVEERVRDLFNDVLFERMKTENPNFQEKVVAIPGDCTLPGLGISEENKKLLTENVNLVFHVAATVRFEENLKTAVETNVLATQEVLHLCHSIKNLMSVVHVSTAYANCYLEHIKEEVYEMPPTYEKALKLAKELTPEQMIAETPALLGKWPNTYTFTKAIAENLVKRTTEQLPICIFRPAIVTSTCFEPIRGYNDNLYGPSGIVTGAGCGVVRAVQCNAQVNANLVPVDLTINGILACAREAYDNFRNDEKKLKVYNYVSSIDNPINYEEFMNLSQRYGLQIPPIRAIWYYSLTLTRSRSLTLFLCLVLHLLPAIFIDGVTVFIGKKPQMTRLYNRVHKLIKTLAYFTMREWSFEADNIRSLWEKMSEDDKKIFNFDVRSFNWESYMKDYMNGIRIYVLKDDMSTLPEAIRKWNRLYWCHQIVKVIFGMLAIFVGWCSIRSIATILA